ncbi:MerR family transcriptional regulator [Streptomyces verrucosisporus]|uniref:MerR family transcriptional regulator n=1 Tax=Streptomyces verrucosisporus TaxID=1695161 RepID=UPI0019D30CB2|nr:MerR family transcriptional regulator [Streptomyces verrucosisporus]MBN3929962.1 MerR family transcriptional regulator [Streptomyces verrucosisporus]
MPSARPHRAAARPAFGQEVDQILLPVGVVAERLEMSTAALRAWERRYGLAPSGRTPGGHRRYSARDLERLERMRTLVRRGVPAADAARAVAAAGPPDAEAEAGAGELTEAMHALDTAAVQAAVSAALARLGAAGAWTTVLAPALVAIGDHWEETGRGVEVEHVTSGIVESALRRHAQDSAVALPPAPGASASGASGPVLLAAAPAEHHTLPLTALAAALAEGGRAVVLAGDLPLPALTDALVRARPGAVVLWARSPATADLSWLRTALETVPVPVPVHPAGPGWPPDVPGAAAPLHDLPGALTALLGADGGRRPA